MAIPDISLRIASVSDAADGIRSFELVHPQGEDLPGFTAGSHLTLQVPSGLLRKYSLCNDPAQRQRYVITVKRDATGRGGSMSLCDDAKAGDTIKVSAPDNAFELVPSRGGYLFIAGGIGITPILSMIRSLGDMPAAPWQLIYLTRSPETTPFREELSTPGLPGKVRIHHDRGDPARALDLWPLLEKPGPQHIYCCGPRALMDAVRDMTGHWAPGHVQFESFVDGGVAQSGDAPFSIRLAHSGRVLQVPVGRSILQVVKDAGCIAPSSCESGTCGTCRTGLLAGEAEHRDMVLMPEEEGSQIMICVSRAKSAELVLDL